MKRELDEMNIPVYVGTASCDPSMGYALPPGQYEVVAVVVVGVGLLYSLIRTSPVRHVGSLQQRIADINKQLGTATANDATTANLLDQRDQYIDQLAQLMDIKVVQNDHNQITVFTGSGLQLVGVQASHLAFDAQGSMTATATWRWWSATRGRDSNLPKSRTRWRRRTFSTPAGAAFSWCASSWTK
jgi:hypothetical protein